MVNPRGITLSLDGKKLKLFFFFPPLISLVILVLLLSFAADLVTLLSLSSSHTWLLSPLLCQFGDPCALGLFTFNVTGIS